jgi:hypothetical protein
MLIYDDKILKLRNTEIWIGSGWLFAKIMSGGVELGILDSISLKLRIRRMFHLPMASF